VKKLNNAQSILSADMQSRICNFLSFPLSVSRHSSVSVMIIHFLSQTCSCSDLALITLSFVSFTFSNRLRHFRPPAVKSLHPFKFTYTLSIHLLLSFWLYICPYVFLSSFCLTLCIFLTVFLWSPRRCNSLIVKHVRLLSVGVHVTKYINTAKVLLKVWNILLHFFHYGWLNFSLHFYGCMCVPS
jgi:hypothetical protein